MRRLKRSINLLPPEMRPPSPWRVLAAAGRMALLLTILGSCAAGTWALQAKAESYREALARAQTPGDAEASLLADARRLATLQESIRRKEASLKKLAQAPSLDGVLVALAAAAGDDVRITRLTVDQGKLSVSGVAPNLENVAALLRALEFSGVVQSPEVSFPQPMGEETPFEVVAALADGDRVVTR